MSLGGVQSNRLKVFYVTKKQDACFWIRIQNPLSQLISRGHTCEDDVFEREIFCVGCHQNPQLPVEHKPRQFTIQYDMDEDIICAVCKVMLMTAIEFKEWRETLDRKMESADVVVFQRPTEVCHLRLMRRAKEMGKKVVQTADDDYINVPDWNSGYEYYSQRRGIIEETFRVCDAVDVTTPYLKDLYSKYCNNVQILPNCQDIELIDATPPAPEFRVFRKPEDRFTPDQGLIGISPDEFQEMRQGKRFFLWGGSPTHRNDLEMMLRAAVRVSKSEDILFGFVAYVHYGFLDAIRKDRILVFDLVPCLLYFNLYKALNAEVSLAPVCDVPFNHGKSSNKAIEAQILGSLPVMSDLVTYRGCSPRGIYTKNDEYSWYCALRTAVNMSEEERLERVKENRKFVEENYDIKKNIVMWEQFYGDLIS